VKLEVCKSSKCWVSGNYTTVVKYVQCVFNKENKFEMYQIICIYTKYIKVVYFYGCTLYLITVFQNGEGDSCYISLYVIFYTKLLAYMEFYINNVNFT